MLIPVTDKKYLMDDRLVDNLKFLNKAVKVKWDAPLVIDGVEGSGKTTLCDQICYYQAYSNNTKYGIDNIVFLPKEFEEFVDTAKPYTSVNWDEAIFGTMGEDWANTINKTILKKWVTIRKKRLFINVCLPYIFMMRTYFAVGRTRALLHVYTPDGISRGFFKLYDYEGKRHLYFKNKKYFSYNGIKPSYRGKFENTEGLFYDLNEYDAKKENAIKSLSEQDKEQDKEYDKRTTKHKLQRDFCMAWLNLVCGVSQRKISNNLDLNESSTQESIFDMKEELIKRGLIHE